MGLCFCRAIIRFFEIFKNNILSELDQINTGRVLIFNWEKYFELPKQTGFKSIDEIQLNGFSKMNSCKKLFVPN